MGRDWWKVHTLEDRFEADLVSQILDENGISYLIRSYMDTAYDGLFLRQKGWGEVLVKERDIGNAKKLIKDFRTSLENEKEQDNLDKPDKEP